MPTQGIFTNITAAGFVAVRLPAGHSCNSYSLWTEDGTAWIRSHNAAGDVEVLVTTDGTNGFPISINETLGTNDPLGAIVCYAKGTSTTNLSGVITQS